MGLQTEVKRFADIGDKLTAAVDAKIKEIQVSMDGMIRVEVDITVKMDKAVENIEAKFKGVFDRANNTESVIDKITNAANAKLELIQAQTSDLHTRTQEAQTQTTKLESEIQTHRQQMNDYTVAVVDIIGEMDKAIANANQNPILGPRVAEKIKDIEETMARSKGGGGTLRDGNDGGEQPAGKEVMIFTRVHLMFL